MSTTISSDNVTETLQMDKSFKPPVCHLPALPGHYHAGYKVVYSEEDNCGCTKKKVVYEDFGFQLSDATTWENLNNVTRAKVYNDAT